MKAGRKPPVERSKPISVYVGELERALIKKIAQSCGMTVSAYLRSVAVGNTPKTVLDLDAVGELAKLNESQSNLIRMLSLIPNAGDRMALSGQIQAVQAQLVSAAKRIRT